MRTILYPVFFVMAISICACGVDKQDRPDDVGDAPDLTGDWNIVLVSLEGTCPLIGRGLATHSPLEIEGVTQDGNNVLGSFEVDGTTYFLTGDVVMGYLTVVLESLGTFIETLGAPVDSDSPVFMGMFNGTDLSLGCTESGVFMTIIGEVEFPVITGEWTLTLTGEASNCDDPSDDGEFLRTIEGIEAISLQAGTFFATYEDPSGEFNSLAGAAINDRFYGGISELIFNPTRMALLNGAIDADAHTVAGDLEGRLVLYNAGDACEVQGDFRIDY